MFFYKVIKNYWIVMFDYFYDCVIKVGRVFIDDVFGVKGFG